MPRSYRWVHLLLEVVGVLAITAGIGWGTLYLITWPFRNFAGANCDETPQQTITHPYGRHFVKTFYRACGAGEDRSNKYFLVWLDTGNPNKGYEYETIVSLRNISPGQAKVTWTSPTELLVSYPKSAQVDEAYSNTFGIHITLAEEPSLTPK
jgi:hypothetical protein